MPRARVFAVGSRTAATLLCLTLCLVPLSAAPSWAQDAAVARAGISPGEMEALLMNGRITARRGGAKGVTDAFRVTLSDGRLTHDAQVQNVDIYRPTFDAGPKFTEFNFRDTYRYNIAAYRLARILGLEN